jgi:hypothetical protein
VADLSGADDATKRIGAVLLLMADEIDRLAGVVDQLIRRGPVAGTQANAS